MTGDLREPNSGTTPRLLILTGTTAVGKTDVSIPLAEALKGEIINADSRQIFCELNIGTAKPEPNQLARVRHHFINEKSIAERWTAGDFAREGRKRINEILNRGHVPVVVGGAMLYLRALVDGFYDQELPDRADYLTLREEWKTRGGEALYQELTRCDPELAAKTDPHDHHRILRGLAVYRHHRVPLSELQQSPPQAIAHPFRLFFLYGDREQTYERVNERARRMVDAGLVEEVKALAVQGWDDTNCNALKTHGYQEVFPYLRGEISRETMIEEIQKAVRHYVKRQLTWYRRDQRAVWIRRDYDESNEGIADRIRRDFCSGIA